MVGDNYRVKKRMQRAETGVGTTAFCSPSKECPLGLKSYIPSRDHIHWSGRGFYQEVPGASRVNPECLEDEVAEKEEPEDTPRK